MTGILHLSTPQLEDIASTHESEVMRAAAGVEIRRRYYFSLGRFEQSIRPEGVPDEFVAGFSDLVNRHAAATLEAK